jgi:hypothetical protein
MTYKPNFTDPRVRKRCVSAIEFIDHWIQGDKSYPIAQSQITKHFGFIGRPLARYLKDSLLICVDKHYDIQAHVCQRYRRNTQNLAALKTILGIGTKKVTELITEQEHQELTEGSFEYVTKSHRSYHRLQNLPKRQRRSLLSRYKMRYEYDIECCALTLLLQHSRQLGLAKATPLLDQIIQDRSQFRQQLSQDLGLSTTQIKSILAKILNGGRVQAWVGNQIYAEVNYNSLMIKEINNHTDIQQYKQELKTVWSAIRPSMMLNPGERMDKKKMRVYNQLEQQVTDVIKKYLKRQRTKHFFVHDGWTCDKAIDIMELTRCVRINTGFDIRIEWTIYEDNDADM